MTEFTRLLQIFWDFLPGGNHVLNHYVHGAHSVKEIHSRRIKGIRR